MSKWSGIVAMIVIAAALITNGAFYYQSNTLLKSTRADIAGIKQELSALTASTSKLTAGISNLQSQASATSSAVRGIQTQMANDAMSLEGLRNQTAALVGESSNLAANVRALKDQASSSAEEITALGDRSLKLEAQSRAITAAASKALPSVVFILTTYNSGEQIAGSGVVMRSDGYILTNKHLVENAKKVMVTLWDRRIYEPTSIVTDDIMDLAMVKIEETGISALPYGDPNSIAVGDWVIALGHALGLSPLEGGATVTEGIISNLGRSFAIGNTLFYDVIQTSAAINVGNSGGPLINIAGEFIGLNSSGVVGAQNIGFAINAATVRHSFEDLVKFGKPQHPYLGVTLTDVNPCTCGDPSAPLGAKIATLGPGNPADKIGLRNNDIVTSFGGQKTDSAASLIRALWRHDPGDKVEIIFWRDGTMIKTDIVLTLRPSESNLI